MQILMSALLAQTTVLKRQHVQTLMAATFVPVIMVTLEMASFVMVCLHIHLNILEKFN